MQRFYLVRQALSLIYYIIDKQNYLCENYLCILIILHITAKQIILKSIVRAIGIKPLAVDNRITLSQDYATTGATSANFIIAN